MGKLSQKVFLVTGATSGMGKATALRLEQEDAFIFTVGRNAEGLKYWEGHENVTAMVCDITKLEDIKAVAWAIESRFGRLDGVCNIAGINDLFYPLMETDDARWDNVLDTDLKAPFRIIRETVPLMIRSGGGSIVNIGSYAGIRGNHGPSYSAAKAGLIGLTRSVAFAHAKDNIRCNIVNPGGTNTNIGQTSGGAYHPAMGTLVELLQKMPVRTFGQPEEIANLCAFLCSDEAA